VPERRDCLRKLALAALAASLIAIGGCAATQKVRVTTAPPGAQITMIRYGVSEVHARLPRGVSIGGIGGAFEAPPLALGPSPLEYEFKLEERGERLRVAGVFVKVTREFTEGLIRAEMDGRVVERRVPFTGKPVTIDLALPAE
jgi:hypothetical protein